MALQTELYSGRGLRVVSLAECVRLADKRASNNRRIPCDIPHCGWSTSLNYVSGG